MATIFVIIALSFLVFIHELGHFTAAKIFRVKVLEFGLGFPPKIFSKKRGETTYSINALPFGGFVKILGEEGEEKESSSEHLEEEKDPTRSFVFQSTWKKVVMLAAGVLVNFIFGLFAFTVVFMLGIPEHLIITDIQANSPAAEKHLVAGDIIKNVSFSNEQLSDPISSKSFIDFTSRAKGKEITFTIERKNQPFEIKITPRDNPPPGEGALGVYLADGGFPRQSFLNAFFAGARETFEVSKLVFNGFVTLLQKTITAPQTATKDLAGPVGIVLLAKESSALGFVYFLQFLALISVNLAVLNLLPFPALDGGRIILALIERIKGSPVSQKVQIVINAVGFLLLIGLMVLVTIQDITRIF